MTWPSGEHVRQAAREALNKIRPELFTQRPRTWTMAAWARLTAWMTAFFTWTDHVFGSGSPSYALESGIGKPPVTITPLEA